MSRAPRSPVKVAVVASVAVVAAYCAMAVYLLFPVGVGLDFVPIRHAAQALVHGRSVYTDGNFVYLPTAAVLFVPAAAGGIGAANAVWLTVSLAALLAAAVIVGRVAPRRGWLFGAMTAMVVLGGGAASDSIGLGNASVLLVPFAVGALYAFHRDRWTLGCSLLVFSLLLKPLLLPMLLVPVLRRRWSALVGPLAAGAAALTLATVTVPGSGSLLHVALYCLRATNLHGTNVVNNLSLHGWIEAHHHSGALGLAGSATVVVIALCALARPEPFGNDAVRVGGLLFATTLLAGSISEVHYLLSLGAVASLQLALAPTRRNAALLLPGIAMLGIPMSVRDLTLTSHVDWQTWHVIAQVALLVGLGWSRSAGRVAMRDAAPAAETTARPADVADVAALAREDADRDDVDRLRDGVEPAPVP